MLIIINKGIEVDYFYSFFGNLINIIPIIVITVQVISMFIFIFCMIGLMNIYIKLLLNMFINIGLTNASTIIGIEVYTRILPINFRFFVVNTNNVNRIMVKDINIIL